MLIEDVIIIQWTGLIVSRYLKLIQEKSEKIILREELPRTESDRWKGKVVQPLHLESGGDVLGAPVPHSLHQQHRGGGERCSHQDRPDDPRGPRLGEVEVGQAVDAGGGEEVVELQPSGLNIFPYHRSVQSPSMMNQEGKNYFRN